MTSIKIRKAFTPSRKPRFLKIQEILKNTKHSTSATPEIKLNGKWLEQLGFQAGKTVRVKPMDKLLIITLDEINEYIEE